MIKELPQSYLKMTRKHQLTAQFHTLERRFETAFEQNHFSIVRKTPLIYAHNLSKI